MNAIKIILSLLMLTSCTYHSPSEFRYKEKVWIVEGFYKGCSGVVEEQEGSNYYEVLITKCNGNDERFRRSIYKDYLVAND